MKLCLQALLTTCIAHAIQIPLRPPPDSAESSTFEHKAWDLNKIPDPDSTGHLIFDTVASLLQHWPNTRYRNGHNIVPGLVPPGTLLYHGRRDNVIPSVPEWVATDPEHSLLFCREDCWHLTLVTARPLKVLYFDGSSAAKMEGGPMDSQDIVAWGKIKPDWTFSERRRIEDLCEWGKMFDLDGFVRMEMDFEIMLCDFSAGVEVASFLNLTSKMTGKDRPGLDTLSVEVIVAGSWHNFYPGETRIVLDLSRLVSFYDTTLSPSLVRKRRGQERWQHRLEGMAESDVHSVMQRLKNVLDGSAPYPSANRIDWATLVKVVVTRFSDRLDLVRRVLNTTNSQIEVGLGDSKLSERAKQAQRHFSTILGPYTLASATPSNASDVSWASPVYRECSVAHTSYIARQQHGFTHSERLLLAAIEDTSGEICRVITKMWAKGVLAGLDSQLEYPPLGNVDLSALVTEWTVSVTTLMEWLDWSLWVRCNPACSFDELCYLPTWPFFRSPRRRPPPGPGHELYQSDRRTAYADEEHNNFEEDWEVPKPKCVRRLEPYTSL
ncbi:hypothetical protein PC9H_000533 [Pleurotus ostreatus]|uniref:Uncharacterized protein n=1 Tax=Pleurotus ostreatus TaxID=5322 RepID=A0A8H7A4D2_PLEOS|nr:uncharacterized protein PC9H_000533 [Pleurotus ostreatus]KAF7440189.1 hypothetical protein PC9H_000533 [Pleurotus ostreatus]